MKNNHCQSCGHPTGAHDNLAEQDLDDPAREEAACSIEGCGCREYEK
ncbi:MAG: hypothetical protein HY398_01670 [Candidatus Doudnabacteria bacterium]|nr:hypothetical protein [Candidatus Doudnabacteria bacterium]